jgi:molybdopterin converting factor small subunit
MIKVKVSIYGKSELRLTSEEVLLNENSTIYDLLDKLIRIYGIHKESYSAIHNKKVSSFTGMILVKNGQRIGYFDEFGLKIDSDSYTTLRDGDKIIILFPVAGG